MKLIIKITVVLNVILSSLVNVANNITLTSAIPTTVARVASPLLTPTPARPINCCSCFNRLLSPTTTHAGIVRTKLGPSSPRTCPHVKTVRVASALVRENRSVFFGHGINSVFNLRQIFNFEGKIFDLLPRCILTILHRNFQPASSLAVCPLHAVQLNSHALQPKVPIDAKLSLGHRN